MNLDQTIQKISTKITQIDLLARDCNDKNISTSSFPILFKLVSNLKEIIQSCNKSLDFLNNSIIQEDFQKVLDIIDTISDSIIYYLTFITSNSNIDDQKILNNISDLYECIRIYFSSFQQIIDRYSQSESSENLYNWLGLETFLFSFCINIQSTPEYPFFNLKMINFYKFYEKINSIEEPVTAVTSFCGTGKTTCLPVILLCRSMRENNEIPFVLLSSSINPKQSENFFREHLSKFVNVTSDRDEYLATVKSYIKDQQSLKKLVLGVFDSFDALSLINSNQKSAKFTRIIVDEVHIRSVFSDVLLAKLADFASSNLFTFSLNVVLSSSSIPPSLLSPFKSLISVHSICETSQYEISEKPPIYDHFVKKIKTEIVPDEVISIINKMAEIDSDEVEEGHVLCFLPGSFVCEQARKAVVTQLSNDEETETKRKIVMINTALKHNESLDDFFERLREEYELNEKLREAESAHEFLYFLPLSFSGLSEPSLARLVKDELPNDLKNINKLVFSTSLSDPSINDKLSVVIDSGLIKENGFDYSVSLRTIKDAQASKEVMNLRKGRLGRTMKGLYVPIMTEKQIPEVQQPPILKEDLTRSILMLKSINIDIEKMNNLPDMPNGSNLNTSIDNLVYIKAINGKTFKITKFGNDILRYPFILIYYAAAMELFKKGYSKGEQNVALFVSAYISTVLTMSNILVQEEMSENLSKVFVKESDVATIINALNILFKSQITDNDQLRDLVESYGFSYSVFRELRSNIQVVINDLFPQKSINEVLDISEKFIQKYHGLISLIDTFILSIEQTYPNFTDSNYITFKCVNGSGGFDSHSTLVFKASNNLKFPKKRQHASEINITRRPGWNGLSIPTECYLFSITRNLNYNTNSGFLVHRATPESKNLISTIELDKIALNPYFAILLEIYFKDLELTYFNNDEKGIRSDDSYPFHYSNAGDRVFVSFISKDEKMKQIILNGANKVIKLLPYTPRSVLILRSDGNAIIEVTSIGTEEYNTSVATTLTGNILEKKDIDYCVNNLNEVAKVDSYIRICSLIFKETCDLKYFDRSHLYIINEQKRDNPPLYDLIIRQFQLFNKNIQQKQQKNRHLITKTTKNQKKNDLSLFQFPYDFIHPSLIRYKESLRSILKWLENNEQIKVSSVVGSHLLMKTKDIEKLRKSIHSKDRDLIKEQLNLNYVAIQVPLKLYEKIFLTIKEHQTWHYDKKFRTIVAPKEEADEVKQLIESNDIKDKDNATMFIENNLPSKVLCCFLSCEDPDGPVLTEYPVTVFFRDGSYYTSKLCRECLIDNFQFSLGNLFVNGKVEPKRVEENTIRPKNIPTVKSEYIEDGTESWPVIPLGLMVYVLLNDPSELSSFISAWLFSAEEFTIRVMMQKRFLWCNYHPHIIYDIVKIGRRLFHCKECDKEIAMLPPDDPSRIIRIEENRQRDFQNAVMQNVEQEIIAYINERVASLPKKKKPEDEERFRRELEIQVREEREEEITQKVVNKLNAIEIKRKKEEEKRMKIEEEKRMRDEAYRKKEEEKRKKEELRILKIVESEICRLIDDQIQFEEKTSGNEVSVERRKEIEAEIRSNEQDIKNEIIERERFEAEKEAQRINKLNLQKSLNFINKLKHCPRCHRPIIKNGGCNHICCQCGIHFCYVCGFSSIHSCKIYDHMRDVHGGIYDQH